MPIVWTGDEPQDHAGRYDWRRRPTTRETDQQPEPTGPMPHRDKDAARLLEMLANLMGDN